MVRDLQNSDAQLKINHLHGLFTPKLLFCPLCSRVLQEALVIASVGWLDRSETHLID
jgi:hypothetical protein